MRGVKVPAKAPTPGAGATKRINSSPARVSAIRIKSIASGIVRRNSARPCRPMRLAAQGPALARRALALALILTRASAATSRANRPRRGNKSCLIAGAKPTQALARHVAAQMRLLFVRGVKRRKKEQKYGACATEEARSSAGRMPVTRRRSAISVRGTHPRNSA